MTDSKGFDLAALLGGVSKMDTGGEQIVRLPLELLDPDPENFYSLDGLDELAANIELVGLLDPIRVRPHGESYMIVSGHRRRAACQLIADSGSDQFAAGVACIVEYGEARDAMRKLRLIYANSATRQLTSAEQSRQAEEVTRLLYELKEQGVEFPGRMRDHVAQACNTTKSKLARLHAIRSNAQEYVLDAYDKGEINESVAYELQKLPRDAQKTFIVARHHACLRLDVLTAEEISKYDEMQSKIMGLRCTASEVRGSVWDKHPLCPIRQVRLEEALRQINGYIPADGCKHPIGTRGNCVKGKCCLGCPELLDCEVRCMHTDGEVTAREEQERAQQEQAEAERQRRQEAFDRDRQEMADSQPTPQRDAGGGVPYAGTPRVDDEPTAPATTWPTVWQTGTPDKEGWYAVHTTWRGDGLYHEQLYWRGAWWDNEKSKYMDNETTVLRFFPLPEEDSE